VLSLPGRSMRQTSRSHPTGPPTIRPPGHTLWIRTTASADGPTAEDAAWYHEVSGAASAAEDAGPQPRLRSSFPACCWTAAMCPQLLERIETLERDLKTVTYELRNAESAIKELEKEKKAEEEEPRDP
jgi:hypothetical protein